MAYANIPQTDEPLQIIQVVISKNANGEILHEPKLHEENLSRIMLHPDVIDNVVMIVSIAGALRKGKSFLLGFFLKYLEAKMGGDWLNKDDTIEGFEWRNGTDGVTHGIQIWSKPFIFENKSKEKVAILLMDTQGVFDCKSTKQDCANTFTLSCLISSVQIFNLMHQIQEDDLENLEYFSEFGKLIQEKSEIKDASKQRLIFLIRDWGCPHEFPFGETGGEAYVRKQLQEDLNQQQQLKKIRQNLNGGFLEIDGFLLPYPGKIVATNHSFAGLVKDMDEEFLQCVKRLVPYVVSNNKLTAKQINCKDVKGKDMLVYIKDFVEILRYGDYNFLETAVEATAAAYRNSAFHKAYKLYEDEMEKLFKELKVESLDDLENHHTRIMKISLNQFTDCPRIKVAEHEQLSFKKLAKEIEDKYPSYEERAYVIAAEYRESAYIEAYRLYEDKMEKLFKNRSLRSLADLRKHHALTNAEALKRFMDCPRIKVAEHETASLVKLEMEIEEKYLLYERKALVIAKKKRNSALDEAYRLYRNAMEELFRRRGFVTRNILEKHHKLTRIESIKEFKTCPRIKVAKEEKSSFDELKKVIDETYILYKQRTVEKKIKNVAIDLAVWSMPATSLAGMVAGFAVGYPGLVLGGAIVGLGTVGYKIYKEI